MGLKLINGDLYIAFIFLYKSTNCYIILISSMLANIVIVPFLKALMYIFKDHGIEPKLIELIYVLVL